ncbi:MAG: STAS/SEC14 domain-containing protein [Gammaproteobacteria bacterium]
MGAEITDTTGSIVTVEVTGRLTESELAAVQSHMAEIIREQGKVRILVLTIAFEGWQSGEWNDFTFQNKNDRYIERMAIIGDEQWKDGALMFTAKGLRPFPIEYFAPGELAKARAWLASP